MCVCLCVLSCSYHAVGHLGGVWSAVEPLVVSCQDSKGGTDWMQAKANTKKHSTHAGQISVWPFTWGWVSRANGQATPAFYHKCVFECVCLWVAEWNRIQSATTTRDKITEIAVVAYDNDGICFSHNSGCWMMDEQTASTFFTGCWLQQHVLCVVGGGSG